MNPRRKMYEKARNIVKNNLTKQHYTVKVTAKTAKYVVYAYSLYQKSCLRARKERMKLLAAS